jgi:hypothetical protein
MPSIWTNFIKEFSAKHNIKYACALSKYKDPLRKAYKLFKEGKQWYEPMTSEILIGGANTWTNFVKEYAVKKNTTYGCALSDIGIKNAYKLFKDGKEWFLIEMKEEPKRRNAPKKEVPKELPKKEAPKKESKKEEDYYKIGRNWYTDPSLQKKRNELLKLVDKPVNMDTLEEDKINFIDKVRTYFTKEEQQNGRNSYYGFIVKKENYKLQKEIRKYKDVFKTLVSRYILGLVNSFEGDEIAFASSFTETLYDYLKMIKNKLEEPKEVPINNDTLIKKLKKKSSGLK